MYSFAVRIGMGHFVPCSARGEQPLSAPDMPSDLPEIAGIRVGVLRLAPAWPRGSRQGALRAHMWGRWPEKIVKYCAEACAQGPDLTRHRVPQRL